MPKEIQLPPFERLGAAHRAAENATAAPAFNFERDTFAFPNELIWEYRFESAGAAPVITRRQPPPAYAHRCFVVVRSARQFLYHARFDPGRPALPSERCRELIHTVASRSARRPSAPGERVSIPGYDGLRAFSRAHEPLLKARLGGAWQSYVLRSHWRMVFPVSRGHQAATAQQLRRSVQEGNTPIGHLVRFPQLTINHGILLFGVAASETGAWQFQAYDPNVPEHPSELIYQPSEQTFLFPRNHYWIGGRVDVIEIYRSWWF